MKDILGAVGFRTGRQAFNLALAAHPNSGISEIP